MKYLLDTMIWMWSVGPLERIGKAGLGILSSSDEEIYLSTASSWEIAIKVKLGKFRLPGPPPTYVPKRLTDQGISVLPVSLRHSLKTYELPAIHRDPFDRLIIAQAMIEGMVILTADRTFTQYPVDVLLCGT